MFSAATWRALLVSARPHHWSKNLLVFLPLLAAHRIHEPDLLVRSAWAFSAASLAASAMYLLNDVLDRAVDRAHPRKATRPIAAGTLGPRQASIAAALAAAGALIIASALSMETGLWVMAYLVIATLYSVRLKRLPGLEMVVLATLYLVRVWLGASAVQIPASLWLTGFTFSLFVSLVCWKRFEELLHGLPDGDPALSGRGYRKRHADAVLVLGIVAALITTGVLLAYAFSDYAGLRYSHPHLLGWLGLIAAILLLRMGGLARRGRLRHDPIEFVLTDTVTLVGVALALLTIFQAA